MELYHETKSKLMAKALGDTPKNKSSDANVSRVGEDDEEEVPVMEGVEEALVMGDDEEELDDTEENISTDDKANGDHKVRSCKHNCTNGLFLVLFVVLTLVYVCHTLVVCLLCLCWSSSQSSLHSDKMQLKHLVL